MLFGNWLRSEPHLQIEIYSVVQNDETFLTQLIKCNKSEFWFSSWENFFANFVRVSECCLLKIDLVGWSILIICKQSLRIQLSELTFLTVQDSSIGDLVG